MSDVTEKKRPKRQRSEWFSDGSVVYERDEADAIFESLESDNQQLRKLLKEVEGVAPDKWIELQAERDALKARVEELHEKSSNAEAFELIANGRAEQAESDLAREKERRVAALTRIEEMTEQVEKMPKWISVKDELPDKEYRVLLLTRRMEIEIGSYGSPGENGPKTWWGDQHIFGYADITHWQPLPSPPAEGDQG